MSSERRIYRISPIMVNGVKVSRVLIDSHYEEKHSSTINDRVILRLVKELDGRQELPDEKAGPYSYFATLIVYEERQYRLIWLQEDNAIYIGVINVYRDNRRK